MIPLTNANTDKLQLSTDSTANVDVTVGWTDWNGSTFTPGRSLTTISSATTTDIVATPGASTYRACENMLIRNRHASASVTVTVIYNNNGTTYELHKATLNAGDLLEYIDKLGFFVVTSSAKLDQMLYVSADITYSTAATFADITGLTVGVKNAHKYAFVSQIHHISGVATTGAQFGVNGPTMTLVIASTIDTVTASVTASTHSAGSVSALNTAITAQTSGSAAITLAHISGFFNPSADGTFAMRATAEVAASMTVKAGSWLWVRETNN